MKNIRKIISYALTFIMVIASVAFMPSSAEAAIGNTDDHEEDTQAGWYLTEYKLIINKKTVTGSLSDGTTYNDTVKIFNADETEMETLESDFENDILLEYTRTSNSNGNLLAGYKQAISWDSPEDYYAEGTNIEISNVSNLENYHKGWRCRTISARFNLKTIKDTYDYKFVTTQGKDQIDLGSEDISIKTEKPIPKAVRGDVAYLIINFNNNTFADAQAIYTYVWKAPAKTISTKNYDTKVSKKGWYLTGYSFKHTSKDYSESKFMSGELCIDTKTIYNGNGDISRSESLENDLYVYDERYINKKTIDNFIVGARYQIKWDTPTSFVAAGETFHISKFSSTLISTTDVWGPTQVSTSAKTNGFDSYLLDSKGNTYLKSTEETTLSSKKVIPEGTNGQIMIVCINISGIGEASYTYTWKTGELQTPSVIHSKVTLYLSGANKALTYNIDLKNSDGYTVTYLSRKTSVATVSKMGVITAKKAGKANITVTFKSGGKKIVKTIAVEVKKK